MGPRPCHVPIAAVDKVPRNMGNPTEFATYRFHLLLMQTIRWCAPRALLSNPSGCLRSLHSPHDQAFISLTDQERTQAVEALAVERKERLAAGSELTDFTLKPPPGGRLLLFYPELSLFDGAAAAVSKGFCDWDNVPAWDTWVGCNQLSTGIDQRRA